MAEETKPRWGDFEEVKAGEFVKWDKVGKEVKGIFLDVEERMNQLSDSMQKVYTLQLEDGTEIRVGGKSSIDAGMKQIVKGQWVMIKYAEEIPSKVKGNNPFKLIKVYAGQVDPAFEAVADLMKPDVPFD